jgi:hypothetical protein
LIDDEINTKRRRAVFTCRRTYSWHRRSLPVLMVASCVNVLNALSNVPRCVAVIMFSRMSRANFNSPVFNRNVADRPFLAVLCSRTVQRAQQFRVLRRVRGTRALVGVERTTIRCRLQIIELPLCL